MKSFSQKACCWALSVLFFLNNILPTGSAYAQTVYPVVFASTSSLQLTGLSVAYHPPLVRGLSVYPDDPLKFDFIIDTGDDKISGPQLKQESEKLIKYFLASLTVPEKELWVNLSPYEKDRIIPDGLSMTQMGIDMLGQDYLLKNLTASLIYPENDLGKRFWSRVYQEAYQKYGRTDIPVNTFNKVWIAPDKAVVYERNNSVFVAGRHLKVMLEEDYLALSRNQITSNVLPTRGHVPEGAVSPHTGDYRWSSPSSDIVRDIVLPAIEKEVNTAKNFAHLRQIYNSLILATWYKKKLRDSLLGKLYVDSNKIRGVNIDDLTQKQKIYAQYINIFKKGVFNFIKEEYDPLSGQTIPRKYFSGGLTAGAANIKDLVVLKGDPAGLSAEMRQFVTHPESAGEDEKVTWQAVGNPPGPDAAQLTILDARESFPFQPINPVADFKAREFPDIRIAQRKGSLPLFIDISDDLKTLTYYEVLDDSKVFRADGSVQYGLLSEANGSLRKIASFPSSYLVSPIKWIHEHLKNTPQGDTIEKIWSQGKRYTRYHGITTSWDMQADRDVWTTNIDTVFIHQRLLEAGVLSLRQDKVKKITEVGVGGGHIASVLAATYPTAEMAVTDISSYALSTTLLNIAANHPQGVAALEHVRKYWGKGIAALDDDQDLIVVNPPYIPAAPFENGLTNDPYRGTGLIREILKDGVKKLNSHNPQAGIYINISSLAGKDVQAYLQEFGDKIDIEPIGEPLRVPLKIRWMSEKWKQWLLNVNGGLERDENLATDREEYWHTLQMYRIRPKAEVPKAKRVAIIGGTFDPLHVAHRKMIEDVKEELGVDEVIVVPTNVSPHKQGKFSAPKDIRYRMAQAAVAGMSGVKVSDFDINREGPSYTIDLVDHIRSQYAQGSKFFFIIGDDNVEALDTWRDFKELERKVEFVTYTRPGHHVSNPRVSVQRLERPGIDISATMIRERIALGLPVTGFVSPQVEKIINENDLYLPEDIFTPDNHDPINSLNGKPFNENKPFVFIVDAHGTLLSASWKNEYALAFHELTGRSFEEGLQWVEDKIVRQMIDTTRDVPFNEIVSMLGREIALNNIQRSPEMIIQAINDSRSLYWKPEMAQAMPGAIEMLSEIKKMGIPIKIVSGTRDSQLVYRQLQHAGFGDLILPEDVFAQDRQDEIPAAGQKEYTARERAINNIMDSFSGHRLLLLDDWVEGARIAGDLDGIFVGVPQGKGLEQKRNYNRIRAEGAAIEITDPKGFKRLTSLIKVLNARREDRERHMVIKKVRMAMAQFNPTVGDLLGNFNRMVQHIETAKSKQADIVVFPELAVTGYLPGDLLKNRKFIDQNRDLVKLLAQRSGGITTVVGFVDIDRWGRLYNALAVLSDGEIKGVYRKRALPNYGVFMEKHYFTPGGSGIYDFEGNRLNKDIFNIDGLMFGINDCEDIWVEKDGYKLVDGHTVQEPVDHQVTAPYKEQADKGARLIINASASPFREGVGEVRDQLLTKRAREMGAAIVYVNTVGGQDEVVFDGNSMAIAADGQILARGKAFEEQMIVMDLPIKTEQRSLKELDVTISVNKNVPDKDKKELEPVVEPVASSPIELKFKALVLGLRDYMRKNGFKKVIFGNSGGIDSGIVGALAAIAIGPENVHSMSLPTRFNSLETKSDAHRLAERLGIGFEETPIEDAFRLMVENLVSKPSEHLSQAEQTAIENLQARLRMVYLMYRSNADGYLLLSTSNKSESAVGYTTLYGDMSGGFALIKDLYKTEVFEMARYINQYLGKEVIPESMINRPPSAELHEGQTDAQSLPDYVTQLDPILKKLIEASLSDEETAQQTGLSLEMVIRIRKLLDGADYKRRQAPIGSKLTKVAFGHHERRMPLTKRWDPQQTARFIENNAPAQQEDRAMSVGDPGSNSGSQLSEFLADDNVPFWELPKDQYVTFLNKFTGNHHYPKRDLEHPPDYTSDSVMSRRDSGHFSAGSHPKNDLETGMKGRGKLYHYGPNQAEDPVFLRFNKHGELETLIIERGDGTGWGFPGGFSESGQENMAGTTATREAIEETLGNSLYAVDFRQGKVIYDGKAFSSRDTDDAWITTRASAVLLSWERSQLLRIRAGDDARSAHWVRIDRDLLPKLVDAHAVILKNAVKAVASGEIRQRDDLVKSKESLLNEVSAAEREDPAMTGLNKGGIDLDPAMMGMQVQKDGQGVVMSRSVRSEAEEIKVEGFTPVIINIVPINAKDLIST